MQFPIKHLGVHLPWTCLETSSYGCKKEVCFHQAQSQLQHLKETKPRGVRWPQTGLTLSFWKGEHQQDLRTKLQLGSLVITIFLNLFFLRLLKMYVKMYQLFFNLTRRENFQLQLKFNSSS